MKTEIGVMQQKPKKTKESPRPPEEPTLLTQWSWTYPLQNCEMLNFCCLNHPIYDPSKLTDLWSCPLDEPAWPKLEQSVFLELGIGTTTDWAYENGTSWKLQADQRTTCERMNEQKECSSERDQSRWTRGSLGGRSEGPTEPERAVLVSGVCLVLLRPKDTL